MSKTEIILTVISIILGNGVINGIITHFLYRNKLKKEMQTKGHEMIANEIGKSLQFVRDMELRLKVQEIYDAENEIEKRRSQVNLFGGECIYPEIFNDWNTFNQFYEVIRECRSKHEKNLSVKTALNVVFIDRYIMQLSLYMSEHGSEKDLPIWGTIFIFDLLKWQKRMDRMLVKDINKHTYKLESHETKKWKRLRKKELIEQYERTILHFLVTGECCERDKRKMACVREGIEKIFSSKSDLE